MLSFLCVAYAVPRDFDIQPGPSAFQFTYDQGQCLSCAAKNSLKERPWVTKQVQVRWNVISELEAVQTCTPICLRGHPLISTRARQLNVCNAGMSIRTCVCVRVCVCVCECVTTSTTLCVWVMQCSQIFCLVCYVPIAHVSSTHCNKHTTLLLPAPFCNFCVGH